MQESVGRESGTQGREGTGDMEQAKEDVRDLRDEQETAMITAAGFGMVGLLIGLVAFFVTIAPHS